MHAPFMPQADEYQIKALIDQVVNSALTQGAAALILRQLSKKDYEPFKRLFEEAYAEYLELLRLNNPQQYQKEKQEKRKVALARFKFYLNTGSSFVAEENDAVIGYVAS